MSPEIRELTLSKGKFEDFVLHKVEKRWVFQFKPGPDCLLAGDLTCHPLPWHYPT